MAHPHPTPDLPGRWPKIRAEVERVDRAEEERVLRRAAEIVAMREAGAKFCPHMPNTEMPRMAAKPMAK